jgi:uroporphyrinogen decarboxylase
LNNRENILRAARFESPERIPVSFSIGSGCWTYYPQDALQELMAEHPILFPDFEWTDEKIVPQEKPWRLPGAPYTDSWGCVWKTAEFGITGAVIEHPLDDWAAFETFVPPSPDDHNGWGVINWDNIRKNLAAARENSDLAAGGLRHGHTFLTLTYLRGYENLIFDMADEHPMLPRLIGMVEEFNLGFVQRYLDAGAEWMAYAEDLGMQRGPMLGPAQFRKYIKPTYQRLIAPARDAGCVIHMHSDGDVRELAEDILDAGVDVLNIQDLVNGIDWMQSNLKGRVCIDLDIDRQRVTRFGSPAEIDAHLRECVEKLASPQGGLMLKFGLYPGTPLENIKAVMDGMEKYSPRRR